MEKKWENERVKRKGKGKTKGKGKQKRKGKGLDIPKNGKIPRFVRVDFHVPKNGKISKDSIWRASEERKTKKPRFDLASFRRKKAKKPRFDMAGFRRKKAKKPRFIRSGGLPKKESQETKIRSEIWWASEERKTKKPRFFSFSSTNLALQNKKKFVQIESLEAKIFHSFSSIDLALQNKKNQSDFNQDLAGFRRKKAKKPRFVRSGGLLKKENQETKIRNFRDF
ncbi:unnamed protein product [Rhizophagus irregularis]|nr:unnamed protein product [Rhizophagus irregularis]